MHASALLYTVLLVASAATLSARPIFSGPVPTNAERIVSPSPAEDHDANAHLSHAHSMLVHTASVVAPSHLLDNRIPAAKTSDCTSTRRLSMMPLALPFITLVLWKTWIYSPEDSRRVRRSPRRSHPKRPLLRNRSPQRRSTTSTGRRSAAPPLPLLEMWANSSCTCYVARIRSSSHVCSITMRS
ncbi:uncharacterized protein B0H18DRAFT_588502 [Fomitopsis serialis]|uniref:uncharacterized protein n=1 Tax=Fomitopsis serialis TaxID=139415 RepID=UPI002008447B|nr:uncharacterized protein B0H18DRAFT_588502 [Neoantrodia serialis]KAH9920602.1 hypothetical protein B0H18DRAFT_588502 [Neoantrodia serialis]